MKKRVIIGMTIRQKLIGTIDTCIYGFVIRLRWLFLNSNGFEYECGHEHSNANSTPNPRIYIIIIILIYNLNLYTIKVD